VSASPSPSERTFWKVLGPGLLFAGAAVGVSHLVQSTRAGAVFGLGLILILVLANLFKYPAFAFGPRYAAATGTSLLEGYRRLGTWALVMYALLTLGTMFTVQAAVTLVTAALAKVTFFGKETGLATISAGLLAVCAAITLGGKFKVLDVVIKVVVAFLTVATVIATIVVLPRVPWGGPWFVPFDSWNIATFGFIAAFVGWMPSAIDISIWHSLWTLAKKDSTGHRPSVDESMLDFNIGYLGTVLLAVCFVLLGAGVMYDSGEAPAKGAAGFALQVIGLYTKTLGDWAGPLISFCALAVMFSTTLTCLDGFPRAISVLLQRFKGAPDDAEDNSGKVVAIQMPSYIGAMGVIAVGSVLLIEFATKPTSPGEPPPLLTLIDVATILSFLTAPILAFMNHRVMHASDLPTDARPEPWLTRLSIAGIIFLSLFALGYIALRFAQ